MHTALINAITGQCKHTDFSWVNLRTLAHYQAWAMRDSEKKTFFENFDDYPEYHLYSFTDTVVSQSDLGVKKTTHTHTHTARNAGCLHLAGRAAP